MKKTEKMGMYIWDKKTDKISVPNTVLEWGTYLQTQDRHVACTEIKGITVSTVFLGLDYSFDRKSHLLFETMIFGSKLKKFENYQERYFSSKEAKKGHKEAVNLVKKHFKLE